MRLMRLGPVGAERPVVRIDDEQYVDVSDLVSDFDERFFADGGLSTLAEVVADRSARPDQVRRFAGERVGAPIARPHQILCIGLNYSDHAETDVRGPRLHPLGAGSSGEVRGVVGHDLGKVIEDMACVQGHELDTGLDIAPLEEPDDSFVLVDQAPSRDGFGQDESPQPV